MAKRTQHMTHLLWTEGLVKMENETRVQILKVGTLVVNVAVKGVTKTLFINNVSYVPG